MRMLRAEMTSGLRASIAADLRPKPPTDADARAEQVRATFQPYVDRLRVELEEAKGRIGVLEGEVERQERNLRVLSATASQYGRDYPKWGVFAQAILLAQQGQRL